MHRGEMAKSVGCSPETLLHYEKIGLLPEPARSEAGYREYDQTHLDKAHFIRRARTLGFDLQAISELLDLANNRHASCATVDYLARNQLEVTQEKIRHLKKLERALKQMIDQCQGGEIEDCQILNALHHSALLVPGTDKGQT